MSMPFAWTNRPWVLGASAVIFISALLSDVSFRCGQRTKNRKSCHEDFSSFLDPSSVQASSCGARLRSVAHQAVLDGEETGSRPIGDADLGVDVLDVVADRLWRDHQLVRDLSCGESSGHE